MSNLIAGYFAGEFGWMLMKWQGIIRKLASNKDYDKICIGCEPQYRFLYEDYATHFIDFPDEIESRNMWYTNGKVYPLRDADIIPSRDVCLKDKYPQEFIKWGTHTKECEYDLLFHIRQTDNHNTKYRNWSPINWEKLYYRYKHLKIGCVGAIEDSYMIKGSYSLQGVDLNILADIMASSKMLISPSSGPAHFASLCGLKHIVWSDKKTVGVIGNEERYKTRWNPFGTECTFIPTWQPTVDRVSKEIDKWL